MLCPFHQESQPSLQLYPDGTFYCFGRHSKDRAATRAARSSISPPACGPANLRTYRCEGGSSLRLATVSATTFGHHTATQRMSRCNAQTDDHGRPAETQAPYTMSGSRLGAPRCDAKRAGRLCATAPERTIAVPARRLARAAASSVTVCPTLAARQARSAPGVSLATICAFGYSRSVRPPESYTEPLKLHQMRAYDLPAVSERLRGGPSCPAVDRRGAARPAQPLARAA